MIYVMHVSNVRKERHYDPGSIISLLLYRRVKPYIFNHQYQ